MIPSGIRPKDMPTIERCDCCGTSDDLQRMPGYQPTLCGTCWDLFRSTPTLGTSPRELAAWVASFQRHPNHHTQPRTAQLAHAAAKATSGPSSKPPAGPSPTESPGASRSSDSSGEPQSEPREHAGTENNSASLCVVTVAGSPDALLLRSNRPQRVDLWAGLLEASRESGLLDSIVSGREGAATLLIAIGWEVERCLRIIEHNSRTTSTIIASIVPQTQAYALAVQGSRGQIWQARPLKSGGTGFRLLVGHVTRAAPSSQRTLRLQPSDVQPRPVQVYANSSTLRQSVPASALSL